jgi:putative ATP-dependent endonuclease of OLD family
MDAIALTLSASPAQAALETDYRNLDTTRPFEIELVIGALNDEFMAATFAPPLWGWDAVRSELADGPNDEKGYEAVVMVRVEGTPDLELRHTIVLPGNDPRPFTVAQRAASGLWNVTTDRSPEAQLRLSRGSLLERAIGRDGLRAPAVAAMQGTVNTLAIPDETSAAIARLSDSLKAAGLRFDGLALSLAPTSGQSPVQLVTLVAQNADGHVPLANFGRGSQQMAMVTLAAAHITGAPIAVIDEIEAGLEPYRQRALIATLRSLIGGDGQVFLTSHSPTVLGCLAADECWTLRRHASHTLTPVSGVLARTLRSDAEALLCRTPVVCEGITEVGVVSAFMDNDLPDGFMRRGIHLVDGGGHKPALGLTEALSNAVGIAVALADDENFGAGERARVSGLPGVILVVSPGGRCIEVAVANAVPRDALPRLVALPGRAGEHLDIDDRLQAVSSRLGNQGRHEIVNLLEIHGDEATRTAIGEAAAAKGWFKAEDAGLDLGRFILAEVPELHPLAQALHSVVSAARDATSGANGA